MVPLNNQFKEDTKNYKVKIMLFFDNESYTLTYDFEEMINENLKSWINMQDKPL